MVEFDLLGKPIPDGKLMVTVDQELAQAWDPHNKGYPTASQDTYKYPFTEIRSHMRLDGCLIINYADDHPELSRIRIEIPLYHVLCIEVTKNSEEYVAAYRKWKDDGSESGTEVRF